MFLDRGSAATATPACRRRAPGRRPAATIGPPSSSPVTRWTVAPLTLTPCASACAWASTPGNAGSSDGWMFRIAFGKGLEQRRTDQPHEAGKADERTPPIAAAQPRSRRSKSSRAAKSRWLIVSVSMPAARARSRPAASGLFEMTTAIRASSAAGSDRVDERLQVAAAARDQDAEQRPRGRIIARRSGPPRLRLESARSITASRLTSSASASSSCSVGRGARDDQADPHVERPEHVGFGHATGRCSHRKSGGTSHARSIDLGMQPVRKDARQVVGDAAAGDVRHPLDHAAGRAAAGSPAGTTGAARAAPRRSSRRAPARGCRAASPAISNAIRRASE